MSSRGVLLHLFGNEGLLNPRSGVLSSDKPRTIIAGQFSYLTSFERLLPLAIYESSFSTHSRELSAEKKIGTGEAPIFLFNIVSDYLISAPTTLYSLPSRMISNCPLRRIFVALGASSTFWIAPGTLPVLNSLITIGSLPIQIT